MRAYKAKTVSQLHDSICQKIINSTADQLDVVSSVDVQVHDVVAHADSMEWEFDLKTFWLSASRWSMMIKQYVDPEQFKEWLDRSVYHIGVDRRGIALMRTKVIKPRGGGAWGNKESRRWGSCMLAVSYKCVPEPQITLYSRTSYLGYLSGMDISVAYTCGRYIAEILGIPMESMKFTWLNEAMQYHNFKSMAYMLCHPDPERAEYYRWLLETEEATPDLVEQIKGKPGLIMTRKWLQKLISEDNRGENYGVTRYNTYRRIRRRYHTEVKGYDYGKRFEGWSYYRAEDKKVKSGEYQPGDQKEYFSRYKPLPSVRIQDLDFTKIGLPLGTNWAREELPQLIEGDYDDDTEDDEEE